MPGSSKNKWTAFGARTPSKPPVTDDFQATLKRIAANDRHLTSISLSNSQLTDDKVIQLCDALRKQPAIHLAHLDLSYNNSLTNDCTLALASVSASSINVSGTQITSDGVDNLLSNTSLRTLTIHQNNLSTLNGDAFARNQQLTTFHADMSQLNGTAINALTQNTSLRNVSLRGNNLQKPDLQRLAQSSIEELNCAFNGINDEDLLLFTSSQALKKLNVSHNCIGNKGAKYIANTPSHLTSLDLSSSNGTLTDEAALYFTSHPTIKELALKPGNSRISEKTVVQVSQSLQKYSFTDSLRYLAELFRFQSSPVHAYKPVDNATDTTLTSTKRSIR